MAITAEHTPHGKPAAEWVAELVGRLKGGDPLAPVTVVVPANTACLATRRALAGAARGHRRGGFHCAGHLVAYLSENLYDN